MTTDRQQMPATLRRVMASFAVVLVAGALVLFALRGEALLLDLAAFGSRVFCL